MKPLDQAFFARDTLTVARELLGKTLVRRTEDRDLMCTITETEAYIGRCDKACHAYGGKRTARTQVLYAGPGTVYIYLIYGMYHCLNFVTEPRDEPAAVLIRGAVPMGNEDSIAQNRFSRKYQDLSAYQRKHLMDGPGKLCLALGLTRAQNATDLFGGELCVLDAPLPDGSQIRTTKRIGIDYAQEAAEFPWRFVLEGSV